MMSASEGKVRGYGQLGLIASRLCCEAHDELTVNAVKDTAMTRNDRGEVIELVCPFDA